MGYIFHKPQRQHLPTLPVMVFGIDEQWVADLIEVINIAKSNQGYRYLLTVVFQVHLGGARQVQDWTRRDDRL